MSQRQNHLPIRSNQYDLVLIDQSKDAETNARAAAETRLTEELNQGGRFKRFIKGIWKGNVAKDYYRQKYQREAEQHIIETQDILIHESTSIQHRDDAMRATIHRFQSEYDEMIHEASGESRRELDFGSDIATSLKGIIREFADGTLDEDGLIEERARFLQAYREEHGEGLSGAGRVQVDNMLDVALAVRGAVEHGESLDNIIEGMRVMSGESRTGVRTEVHTSMADKVYEKLGKSKIGTLLGSEATVAAATVAASILRLGSRNALGAAAMTVAPGIGAGIIAGWRERKRTKEDRAQHAREMAQGKTYNEVTAQGRQNMEAARYVTVPARDLSATLDSYLEEGALDGDEALRTALGQLSAITARENYSDIHKVDLISYSSVTDVEQERFQLALSRAQLKTQLRDRMTEDVSRRLGYNQTATIDELIQTEADNFIHTEIRRDIVDKNAAFNKLRKRRVAAAAATGVVVGMAFGAAAQEVGASLSSTREGLVEQLWPHERELYEGKQHNTVLNGVFGGENAVHTEITEVASTFETEELVGDRAVFTSNMAIYHNDDGTLRFENSRQTIVVDNVGVERDGSLTEEGLALLSKQGIVIEDTSLQVEETIEEVMTVDVAAYMENHRDDTTRVTRELWYDNDTPAPNFDKNELGLHWGGQNGSGITASGELQLSIATMQLDGSYHGNQSVSWQSEAQNGTLKLAVSPTGDTQTTPFLVDVRPDGTIDIPDDHPAAPFFENKDGRAVFNGRYAEVVQMTGANQDGVERIRPLATLVGQDNISHLQDTVSTQEAVTQPRYEVIALVETVETRHDSFTEMAPVLPIVGRRSLEVATQQRIERPPYYYGYNRSPEEQRKFKLEECSPRLNEDPKARLHPSRELAWRRERIKERQGESYLAEIDAYIDASEELRELSADTKAIVTIPVAAASEQDSIYKTLQSYAKQEGDMSLRTILLHVNWFDKPKAGGVSQADQDANVQRTWDEIERARRDFPQLKLATMRTEWSRSKQTSGTYGDGIIGHVARRMYDVATMSVERQMRKGSIPKDQEVLLIRNDADAQGIHRRYLDHMVKAMDEHPENDVFTGTVRWGTARHHDLPGLAIVSNFREGMHIMASRKGFGRQDMWPPTPGINTAVRMSTFAAVGGAGDDPGRTGVGSDDYSIGGRIKDGRQNTQAIQRQTYSRRSRRARATKSRRAGGYYGTRGVASASGDYSYHRHVAGATIDTAPERLERAYVNNIAIHHAWDNWDNTTRSEGLDASARYKDDLTTVKGRSEMIKRIEQDLSIGMSEQFHSRQQVASVLAFMFKGPSSYTINRSADGTSLDFRFTPEGRKELLRNILYRNGAYDPLGGRVRRLLYSEVAPYTKKRPVSPRPVLV